MIRRSADLGAIRRLPKAHLRNKVLAYEVRDEWDALRQPVDAATLSAGPSLGSS